ncbi:MAG: hypothetical protein ACPIA2_17335, partial [Mariniblastus sp.]
HYETKTPIFSKFLRKFKFGTQFANSPYIQSKQSHEAEKSASKLNTLNCENPMNAKRMLLNAVTICVLATAVLLSQSVLSGSASATPGDAPAKGDNLRERVKILELLQDEDDKEFLLVDASLSDLNARVDANEARAGRLGKRLTETEGRAGKMAKQISENRSSARMIRASIERLKADLRANGIKLSD